MNGLIAIVGGFAIVAMAPDIIDSIRWLAGSDYTYESETIGQ